MGFGKLIFSLTSDKFLCDASDFQFHTYLEPSM
jgi:hypothetical protein